MSSLKFERQQKQEHPSYAETMNVCKKAIGKIERLMQFCRKYLNTLYGR
jgi:hypothetical protein